MRNRRVSTVALAAALGIVMSLAVQGPAQADRIRDKEWWLVPLHFGEARAISRGDGVTVGLIDSPIDTSHPALTGRVLAGKGWKATDPVNGWGRGKDTFHGTGMASLIAGQEGDDGFIGVAPGAKILPFASSKINGSGVAEWIRWLTDHGATVINMSIGAGGQRASAQEKEAVRYALSRNVVLVASAGNVSEDGEPIISPGSIPGVIAVSGADTAGDAWPGSSRGPEVVVAAPATGIVAAAPKEFDASGYVIAEWHKPGSGDRQPAIRLSRKRSHGRRRRVRSRANSRLRTIFWRLDPTMPATNRKPRRDSGLVWGTVMAMCSGIVLSVWLGRPEPGAAFGPVVSVAVLGTAIGLTIVAAGVSYWGSGSPALRWGLAVGVAIGSGGLVVLALDHLVSPSRYAEFSMVVLLGIGAGSAMVVALRVAKRRS